MRSIRELVDDDEHAASAKLRAQATAAPHKDNFLFGVTRTGRFRTFIALSSRPAKVAGIGHNFNGLTVAKR